MTATVLALPWPPSVNAYWRHPTTGKLAGSHLISEKGRAYREAVGWACNIARIKSTPGRLAVHVEAFPPDRRTRDLDNLFKSLLDALTYAGAWVDDAAIDCLSIERKRIVKDGAVFVRITQIGEGV